MEKVFNALPLIAAIVFGFVFFKNGKWEFALFSVVLLASIPFVMWLRSRGAAS